MNATSDTILNRALADAPASDELATARTSINSTDRIAPLPAGAINVDIDTLRDYAPGYGFTYDRSVDPVYQSALPRFLELLEKLDVPATLFTIGRDAANERNRDVLRQAFAAGHEPGNHTYTHPRQLSKMPRDAMRRDILEGHDAVAKVAGREPVGFRSPCYDVSGDVLSILDELHYQYDSSVHPTILGPVVDAVVFLKSRGKSREWRPGTYFHMLAPLKAYRPNRRSPWRSDGNGELIELPLSAVPWSRLPFYGTWLHTTGKKVFDKALSSIRRSGSLMNFHFHAVEMLDLSDPGVDPRFKVHPGLATPLAERRALIEEVILNLKSAYELVTLAELAERSRDNKASKNPSGNSGEIS
ncbi:MAG: polysaccharide deacetylase family protein [Phycisphaerales bacterium]|nr:polysaccharide deacetylase family protein [Phycisphaerales bacterium]MCB9856202.1 polysaccharide deacetylase family protein [Phycisphaerales bacterium]MCB9863359.1 polysaccharide deacetylase family protein [Phycisphaerales bacterium]